MTGQATLSNASTVEKVEMPSAEQLVCTGLGLTFHADPVMAGLIIGKCRLALACYERGEKSLDSAAYEAVQATDVFMNASHALNPTVPIVRAGTNEVVSHETPVSNAQFSAFQKFAEDCELASNTKHPRVGP